LGKAKLVSDRETGQPEEGSEYSYDAGKFAQTHP
jgi:hypothetical protein